MKNELSKSEEQLMKHLWELEPCFMKDLLDALPVPKPAKTTVATLLKRMIDKEFVGFETFGNSRRYFCKVKKEDYLGRRLNTMIEDFSGDGAKSFASFFTAKAKLSEAELQELRRLIDEQLKDQS